MPKQKEAQSQGFSKEEWIQKVQEKIMMQSWGSAVMWSDGVLFVEIVRVGDSEDVMIRIRTPNVKNAIKLTRREHVDALVALAEAITANERSIRDKLEAIREALRESRRTVEEV